MAWRKYYYAKQSAGISILFHNAWTIFSETDKLHEKRMTKLDNGVVLRHEKVLYQDEDKKECIKELLEMAYDIFKQTDGEYNQQILKSLKTAINNMRCFFKNKYFYDEKEYRITLNIPEEILQSDDGTSLIQNKGFFERGNVLIPYMDCKFDMKSIKEIILNPYIQQRNSTMELSIKELLQTKGQGQIDIFLSGIPVRKYE